VTALCLLAPFADGLADRSARSGAPSLLTMRDQ
jgi:hypothetical protein